MLTSLALIFLFGLAAAGLCKRIKIPSIIGMLVVGIVLGPCVLDLLDPTILSVSGDLRQMALIIILIKAGLSLRLSDLKQVGRPAVLLSFLPACCEILAFVVFGPMLLPLTRTEAALMGAVLSAVSPAVVIPRMVRLMEEGYGTNHSIPQMLLAGSSCDDVFVIVLFSTFLGMAQGGQVNAAALIHVPVSIVLGLLLGAVVGLILSGVFERAYVAHCYIRNSTKVIIVLGVAFLLVAVEDWLEGIVPLSGLLAVVSMACVLRIRCISSVTQRLSEKFGKLWIAAEVMLFVLVGAAVDIRSTLLAGASAIMLILLALTCRCIGVALCVCGTRLTRRERLFCMIAYMPKATVQAAIGSVPLSLGLPCGGLVLSVAVLGILITAPLGAIGMDLTYRKLLEPES